MWKWLWCEFKPAFITINYHVLCKYEVVDFSSGLMQIFSGSFTSVFWKDNLYGQWSKKWAQTQTWMFCTGSRNPRGKINAKTTHSEDVNIANLLSISPLLKGEYAWHLIGINAWHRCQSKSIYFLYIRSLFYFKSYMHTGWQQADFPNCSALSLLAPGTRPSRYSVPEVCSASSRAVPPTISPLRRSLVLLQ